MDSEQVIAYSAIFISLVSLTTSIYFSVGARKHDRKSVLPYPYLERADYEDEIRVRLHNKGTGPLILLRAVTRNHTGEGHLIDLVPDQIGTTFVFSAFARITEARALLPGEYCDLLVAKLDPGDEQQVQMANLLRRFLMTCSVVIEYVDVYETRFQPYATNLSWFGRRFEGEEPEGLLI